LQLMEIVLNTLVSALALVAVNFVRGKLAQLSPNKTIHDMVESDTSKLQQILESMDQLRTQHLRAACISFERALTSNNLVDWKHADVFATLAMANANCTSETAAATIINLVCTFGLSVKNPTKVEKPEDRRRSIVDQFLRKKCVAKVIENIEAEQLTDTKITKYRVARGFFNFGIIATIGVASLLGIGSLERIRQPCRTFCNFKVNYNTLYLENLWVSQTFTCAGDNNELMLFNLEEIEMDVHYIDVVLYVNSVIGKSPQSQQISSTILWNLSHSPTTVGAITTTMSTIMDMPMTTTTNTVEEAFKSHFKSQSHKCCAWNCVLQKTKNYDMCFGWAINRSVSVSEMTKYWTGFAEEYSSVLTETTDGRVTVWNQVASLHPLQ